MHQLDLRGQVSVLLITPGRAVQVLIEGGTGDLQQRARPLTLRLPRFSASMNG